MRPVLFEFGPITFHSFGAMVILAFFAAFFLARRRAPKYGFTPVEIGDLCFWALIWGILGARVLFILQDLPYFLARPEQLYSLQFAGLTSYGGILFGGAYVGWWSFRRRRRFASILDVLGLPMMLGHIIGRIGCLLHGCCFGGPCGDWYCVPLEVTGRAHNPAQLYDGLFNLIGIAIILRWERKSLAPGQAFSLFLIFHNISRFIYEFWRAGTRAEVDAGLASSTYMGELPITQAQFVSLLIVLLGIAIYVLAGRRGERTGEVSAA
jgi:phosphatidylglycerol---prolipoprotein diacylglyceryl transferase